MDDTTTFYSDTWSKEIPESCEFSADEVHSVVFLESKQGSSSRGTSVQGDWCSDSHSSVDDGVYDDHDLKCLYESSKRYKAQGIEDHYDIVQFSDGKIRVRCPDGGYGCSICRERDEMEDFQLGSNSGQNN